MQKKNPKKENSMSQQNVGNKAKVNTFNIKDINISLKCKNENQKKFIKLIEEKQIIIGAGYAGTGKTYLACAKALQLLKEEKFTKIILIKSVTTLEDEEIGHLKGGMKEKMEGTMFSFMYNFIELIGEENTNQLIELGYIQILPLAYLRGVSLSNVLILADEIQNLNHDKTETLMTRLGMNSKLVMIGDEKQIDLKKKKTSALTFICNKFENIDSNIGSIRFNIEDIVRNPLIIVIEKVFDEYREENEKTT